MYGLGLASYVFDLQFPQRQWPIQVERIREGTMLLISKLLYCMSSPCVASRFPQQQRSCKVEGFRVQDEASSVWYSEEYSYHEWAQVKLITLGTSKGGEKARRGIAAG